MAMQKKKRRVREHLHILRTLPEKQPAKKQYVPREGPTPNGLWCCECDMGPVSEICCGWCWCSQSRGCLFLCGLPARSGAIKLTYEGNNPERKKSAPCQLPASNFPGEAANDDGRTNQMNDRRREVTPREKNRRRKERQKTSRKQPSELLWRWFDGGVPRWEDRGPHLHCAGAVDGDKRDLRMRGKREDAK